MQGLAPTPGRWDELKQGERSSDHGCVLARTSPLYRTLTCTSVLLLLLLKSSSDSHTFLFQTLVYHNFYQKRRYRTISTHVRWMEGLMDGRTHPLIDM